MSKSGGWSHPTLRVWIALSLLIVIQASASAESNRVEHNARKIKQIIDELKKQMGITEEIQPVIVPRNDLIVSVQPIDGHKGAFELSFEDSFLQTLDDEDLRAVIAHELGHVWIFTHHPYLQTEELANSIAIKAVTPDALDRVYEKVRSRPSADSHLAASVH